MININSLFAYIMVLANLLPQSSMKETFIDELHNLLVKYTSFINQSLMGFPENYEDVLRKYAYVKRPRVKTEIED